MSDPVTRALTGRLAEACAAKLDGTPPIEELVPLGEIRQAGAKAAAAKPGSPRVQEAVAATRKTAAKGQTWDFEEDARGGARRRRGGTRPSRGLWIGAACAAAVLVIGLGSVGAYFAFRKPHQKPAKEPEKIVSRDVGGAKDHQAPKDREDPPIKPDLVKPEPVRPEPVKPEPAKPESVKPDPLKPEPVKPEPAKPEPVKPDPVKPDPVKPDPPRPEPVDAKPVKPESTVVGQAAAFRRGGQYVDVTGSGYIGTNLGTSNFSFFVWLKTTAKRRVDVFVLSSVNGPNRGMGALLNTNEAPNKFQCGPFWQAQATSAVSVNDGNWHLCGFVVTAGSWQVWIDGAASGTPVTPKARLSYGNNTLWIGGNPAARDFYFDGDMQEAVFFNRALSSTDIATIYNNGAGIAGNKDSAPWSNGLVGGFHFNGDFTDYSNNGSNGTNHGATFVARPLAGPSRPASIKPDPVEPRDHQPPAPPIAPGVVQLSGRASDVVVGGGGRYLVMFLRDLGKFAVFDVTTGKVVKELPAAEPAPLFAAGASQLAVVYPARNPSRYGTLTRLEKTSSAPLPANLTRDSIRQVCMGSASKGPLFVYLPREKRTLTLNLNTLATTEVHWRHWAPSNAYGPLQMRAAPDGSLLVGWSGGWAGMEMAFFKNGVQAGSHDKIGASMPIFGLPSADARLIYTPKGVVARDPGAPVPASDAYGKAYIVPAHEPGYFIALFSPLPNTPYDSPTAVHLPGTKNAAVYSEDGKRLFNLTGCAELSAGSDMYWEKRIHYYPRTGLLVTLAKPDQLVIRRVEPLNK